MYESEFKDVKNGVMVYAAMPVSQHDAFLEKYREVIREEAENPDLKFRLTAVIGNDSWNWEIRETSAPACVESLAFIFVFEGAGDITAQDLEEHKWFCFPNYKWLRDCLLSEEMLLRSLHPRIVKEEDRIAESEFANVKNSIRVSMYVRETEFEELLAKYRGFIEETADLDLKYHLADVREVCDAKPRHISSLENNFTMALIFVGPGFMDYDDLKEQTWFDFAENEFCWSNCYWETAEIQDPCLSSLLEQHAFNHLSEKGFNKAVSDFQECRDLGGFGTDISRLSPYNFADEEIGVYPCSCRAYSFVKVAHRVLPPGYERPKSNIVRMYGKKFKEIMSRPLDPDKPAVVFVITGDGRTGWPDYPDDLGKRHRFRYGCVAVVWSNEAFKALPFKEKIPLIKYGAKEIYALWDSPDWMIYQAFFLDIQ
ncbi:hypothetical protein [Succinimonas sp.]|uniref:hypothetical protein n=1 Tax=Succinimonas sp. TaxID=1936151 RepID=UPI0038663D0C